MDTQTFPAHRYHGIPIGGRIGDSATLSAELLWAIFQGRGRRSAENHRPLDHRRPAAQPPHQRRLRPPVAGRPALPVGLTGRLRLQAGGLRPAHSADIIDAHRREREMIERSLGNGSAPGVQHGATLKQLLTEMGAQDMMRRLGHGQAHVFLDIYPLHRFYMERGWAEFQSCLPARSSTRYAVHWEVSRQTLAFATPFPEVLAGFEQIEQGRIAESVRTLARHEQVNVLQRIMYDDTVMRMLLDWNQLAWAVEFPSGDYEEIRLNLSAQCPAKAGTTTTFSKERYAKLWDPLERMPFVFDAAERLDELLGGPERARVEESIREVAAGTALA